MLDAVSDGWMVADRIGNAFARWLVAWINVYFVGLFTWLVLWLVAVDRITLVELAASLAVWFFTPIPMIVLFGLLVRRRFIWVATGVSVVIFAWLWGGLFIPRGATVSASGPLLTVMTYNALGPQSAIEASLDVIRAEQPDVVAIQELNPDLGRALGEQLIHDYPYQVLDPGETVVGMGVISRYPLALRPERLPLRWIGVPQILDLDWNGRRLTLVNFHTWPPQYGEATYEQVTYVVRVQAEQGAAISAYARQAAERGPVIAVGDANATDLNTTYRNMVDFLKDSFREVGFGFGHTWGGSRLPETLFGPMWLARIDYVLHSPDLEAVEARVAKFDGVSDHRGVVTTLRPVNP